MNSKQYSKNFSKIIWDEFYLMAPLQLTLIELVNFSVKTMVVLHEHSALFKAFNHFYDSPKKKSPLQYSHFTVQRKPLVQIGYRSILKNASSKIVRANCQRTNFELLLKKFYLYPLLSPFSVSLSPCIDLTLIFYNLIDCLSNGFCSVRTKILLQNFLRLICCSI